MSYCELCGSFVREGDYGQSKYICENMNCERAIHIGLLKKEMNLLNPF